MTPVAEAGAPASVSLPDDATLQAMLHSVLDRDASANTRGTIVSRAPNKLAGRNTSEIVVYGNEDMLSLRTLFCKYGSTVRPASGGRGLPYEAAVHRAVLRPAGFARPVFWGECRYDRRDTVCLVFEHLEEVVQANDKSAQQELALGLAAKWIGDFHLRMLGTSAAHVPLEVLDREHCALVAERADEFSQVGQQEFPLLRDALASFRQRFIDELLAQPATVVHGDFFADNVLFTGREVFPIDWEWCAIGPGTIDFGCLTESWPESTVAACALEYQRGRWPDGAPTSFARDVDLARLYLCFRYMSFSQEFTMHKRRRWRFKAACSLAAKLRVR